MHIRRIKVYSGEKQHSLPPSIRRRMRVWVSSSAEEWPLLSSEFAQLVGNFSFRRADTETLLIYPQECHTLSDNLTYYNSPKEWKLSKRVRNIVRNIQTDMAIWSVFVEILGYFWISKRSLLSTVQISNFVAVYLLHALPSFLSRFERYKRSWFIIGYLVSYYEISSCFFFTNMLLYICII